MFCLQLNRVKAVEKEKDDLKERKMKLLIENTSFNEKIFEILFKSVCHHIIYVFRM